MADVIDINEYRNKKLGKLVENSKDILEKDSKRNRAGTSTFVLMLITAILFDVTQWFLLMIPFLGWVLSSLLSIFAWLTFYVWTSIKGWGLSDTLKQLIVKWAIPFAELIPGLNAVPTWTIRVVASYSFLKAEDALYNASGGRLDVEAIENVFKKVA